MSTDEEPFVTDLREACAEVVKERDDAIALLVEYLNAMGDTECRYDHHGNCQAHFLEPRGQCLIDRTNAYVARFPR